MLGSPYVDAVRPADYIDRSENTPCQLAARGMPTLWHTALATCNEPNYLPPDEAAREVASQAACSRAAVGAGGDSVSQTRRSSSGSTSAGSTPSPVHWRANSRVWCPM